MADEVVVETKELPVKARFFDLKTFKKVSIDSKITYEVPQSIEAATKLAEDYGVELLDVAITGLEKVVKASAVRSLSPAGEQVKLGIYRKFVNTVMRLNKPWSRITERDEQTKSIEAAIASDEKVQAKLKMFASMYDDMDFDDDDEESESAAE